MKDLLSLALSPICHFRSLCVCERYVRVLDGQSAVYVKAGVGRQHRRLVLRLNLLRSLEHG